MMHKLALLVYVSVINVSAIYSASIAEKNSLDIDKLMAANPSLVNLGSINGKFFFMDPTKRTFYAAHTYCETQSMRPFSIESVAERDFLYSKSSQLGLKNTYWTSGRDAGPFDQYYWTNGKKVEQLGLAFSDSKLHACISYNIYSSSLAELVLHDCNIQFPVICMAT